MTLAELQRSMRVSFLESGSPTPETAQKLMRAIAGDGLSWEQRLGIHGNNILLSLTDTIAATFPVVRQLVGHDFFDAATREFIRKHPPQTGLLFEYGGAVPEFLEGFPPAAGLPYLADVARLEWARNLVYHAADAEPLTPEKLGAFPPERLGELNLILHPAHRFMSSPYPVDRIWQSNQSPEPSPETINLDEGECFLLILRPHAEVRVMPVSGAGFAFLVALKVGETIASATDAALRADPGFNLQFTLIALFNAHAFSNAQLKGATHD